MENLVDRFIRYARINTQSDESSKTCPSTPAQLEFANMLCNELKSSEWTRSMWMRTDT